MSKLEQILQEGGSLWIHIEKKELDAFYAELKLLGVTEFETGLAPTRERIGEWMVFIDRYTICPTFERAYRSMAKRETSPRMEEYADLKTTKK